MTFEDPEALLLLPAIVPLLVLAARRRRSTPAAIGFPGAHNLVELRPSLAVRLHQALPWLRALTLAVAVVALARPQWGVEVTRLRREGIAIAMVIDVSSSMRAMDLRLGDRPSSRLDVVKAAFREFVLGGGGGDGLGDGLGGRDGDAIGMIAFARYADAVIPPTLDHGALVGLLDQLDIVENPIEDGTAIGDAVLRAAEMLRRFGTGGGSSGASGGGGGGKVVILLTDGSNNVGQAEPLVAARIAAAFGIRIYSIGAGTTGTAAFPVAASDGQVEYRTSAVTIDEATLTAIARATDGRYFRATDGAALRSIYAEIDRLEKTRHLVEHHQLRLEAFPLLVGLGLVLLLVEIVLANTRLQTIP